MASSTLRQGMEYVQDLLGAKMQLGGRHELMGTHNALLRLGPMTYLEVISIDPEAPRPTRPRWFGLDDPAMRLRLSLGPRLITWVARTNDLHSLVTEYSSFGSVLEMERGDFRWKMALDDKGRLNHNGVVPIPIQWLPSNQESNLIHPCERLEDKRIKFVSLTLRSPNAVPDLPDFGIEQGPLELTATLETSTRGIVEL